MSTVNDIPVGLRVPAQVPLDAKLYVANEASLLNLGISNNLAFTYYQGMIVYCVAERRRYEWREGAIGEVGLLPVGFTYPSPLVVNGVVYSGKTFNFFIVIQNLSIGNVGTGTSWYKGFNILGNIHEFKTFTSTGLLISFSGTEVNIENKSGTNIGLGSPTYKGVNALTKLHEFRSLKSLNAGITINQVGDEVQFNSSFYNTLIQAGTGITVTGTGTVLNPYIISTTATASPWLTGDIKEVYCTQAYMIANFTQTGPNAGLGILQRIGWAICNGNNGTPNDSGKVIVAWGASYPTLGVTGGSTNAVVVSHTHTISNIGESRYGTYFADPGTVLHGSSGDSSDSGFIPTLTVSTVGESGLGKNMQPYVVRLKIMKL